MLISREKDEKRNADGYQDGAAGIEVAKAVEEGFEPLEKIGRERWGLSRLLGVADLQDDLAAPGVGVERLGDAGSERLVLHASGIQSQVLHY